MKKKNELASRSPRRWILDAAALALSTALLGVFFLPRLPSSIDFILPRRAGWTIFQALIQATGSRVVRAVVPAVAVLLILAAVAALLFNMWERWRIDRPDLASVSRREAVGRMAVCLLGL